MASSADKSQTAELDTLIQMICLSIKSLLHSNDKVSHYGFSNDIYCDDMLAEEFLIYLTRRIEGFRSGNVDGESEGNEVFMRWKWLCCAPVVATELKTLIGLRNDCLRLKMKMT
jgi:hypothetical protein